MLEKKTKKIMVLWMLLMVLPMIFLAAQCGNEIDMSHVGWEEQRIISLTDVRSGCIPFIIMTIIVLFYVEMTYREEKRTSNR